MDDENFNQLLESVNQADDIMQDGTIASNARILDVIFETAEDLNDAGVMSDSKLNEFKELCSEEIKR